VFYNLNGEGYTTNPFEGEPDSFHDLALRMSEAYVSFVTTLDPNVAGASPAWPVYDLAAGGGVGENIVFAVTNASDATYVEMDDYRAEAMQWWADNLLDVFGN
jgi:hypothetical protein